MIRQRKQSLLLIAMAALAFIALEIVLVMWVDRPLSEYLRALDGQHHELINIFRAYTDLGKSVWYLWPSGIAIIVCAFGLRLPGLKASMHMQFLKLGPNFLFFFTCIAVSGIVTDIIKPILGRARPVLLEREGTYGFHPFSVHTVWNGMPSGHATTAFALAFCLMTMFPRQRYLLFSLAFILAVSRIMVNAHYLSDVVAGGMVGFISVSLLRHVFSSSSVRDGAARLFSTTSMFAKRR